VLAMKVRIRVWHGQLSDLPAHSETSPYWWGLPHSKTFCPYWLEATHAWRRVGEVHHAGFGTFILDILLRSRPPPYPDRCSRTPSSGPISEVMKPYKRWWTRLFWAAARSQIQCGRPVDRYASSHPVSFPAHTFWIGSLVFASCLLALMWPNRYKL